MCVQTFLGFFISWDSVSLEEFISVCVKMYVDSFNPAILRFKVGSSSMQAHRMGHAWSGNMWKHFRVWIAWNFVPVVSLAVSISVCVEIFVHSRVPALRSKVGWIGWSLWTITFVHKHFCAWIFRNFGLVISLPIQMCTEVCAFMCTCVEIWGWFLGWTSAHNHMCVQTFLCLDWLKIGSVGFFVSSYLWLCANVCMRYFII